ncbi:MAG: hypothetical protein ABJO09_17380 [Hyphomicrobiales bacterium]
MSQDFLPVFKALRPLFAQHADKCVVLCDEPFRYYLGTHEVRAKDGYRTDFGGVEINKNYVSAHLMPIYIHPEMSTSLSPGLKRRMQGKSCFNFKKPDVILLKELDCLIKLGISQFENDGRI